jgi:hypothetical protein
VALLRRTSATLAENALDRSPRWTDERTENCTGQQELKLRWEATRAVPTVVKEFVPAGTQDGEDVLEVRGRAGRCAEGRWIEQPASHREKGETRQAAADLEPTRADVLVRDAVAYKMEDRSRDKCREPRASGCARCGTCRYVERDDHGP